MKRRYLPSGMTLIEVMVALAIFAITGTAILKATSDHISGVGQIEEVTIATWVINNRLTHVQLEAQWPPRNNQKGSMPMAGRTWYWQQFVTKTTDNDLRSVEIRVGLNEDYSDSITSVVTFVANQKGEEK